MKHIYIRPVKAERSEGRKASATRPKDSAMRLKDLALKRIDTMMKVFDRTCEQECAYTDEVMSVYARLLGNIEMVDSLGLMTEEELRNFLDRARKRKDYWLRVFEAVEELLKPSVSLAEAML